MESKDKEFFMRAALEQARLGAELDEVPIGAVICKNGEIIASAHNLKESNGCALDHAETVAIRQACLVENNWWLEDCDMFVTLEPCAMCAGAIINSRLRAVYFGAYDKKAGCIESVCRLTESGLFNHDVITEGGILAQECAAVLSGFFEKKRKK